MLTKARAKNENTGNEAAEPVGEPRSRYTCVNTFCDSSTASPVIGMIGEKPRWPWPFGPMIEKIDRLGIPNGTVSDRFATCSELSGNRYEGPSANVTPGIAALNLSFANSHCASMTLAGPYRGRLTLQ